MDARSGRESGSPSSFSSSPAAEHAKVNDACRAFRRNHNINIEITVIDWIADIISRVDDRCLSAESARQVAGAVRVRAVLQIADREGAVLRPADFPPATLMRPWNKRRLRDRRWRRLSFGIHSI